MTTGNAGRAVGLAGAFAGLVVALVVAAAPPRPAVAAGNNEQKEKEPKEYPRPSDDQKKEYALLGAAACQTCHDRDNPKAIAEYQQTLAYEFIRLWENKVWSAHDLHSTAYRSLITDKTPEDRIPTKVEDGVPKKVKAEPNKTAQQMEDKFRKYKGKDYYVATDKACLACHASTLKPFEKAPHASWDAASFDINEGVGCEMCHGHGSMYETRHKTNRPSNANPPAVRVVDWRDYPAEVKKEWGLVNLRDPATATRTCASCHIGNMADGRFVTHEMYAVGHPPLPPLDLMAYAREQPRHWGFASEMKYITKLADQDEKDNTDKAYASFHFRKGESFVARRFVESALATLGATALLGEQLADDAKKKKDGLDFAAFDCYSCHHNLKYPSERQERGFVGRPGRPLYRPAAFALARLVVDHAAGMENGGGLTNAAKELDAAELKLADAFTTQSYGDIDMVKGATAALAKWSEDTRAKLAAVRYTPAQVKTLYDKLVATATVATADGQKKPVGDPEVAQLYTWAVETLYIDLQSKDLTDKKVEPKALKAMREAVAGTIVTRLRPNVDFYYEQDLTGPVLKPTNDDPVEKRLEKRMDTFNSFRGDPFRKAIGGVKLP